MIQRLLIANRGEIACRITQTARRMGMHVIAVYSEADAQARHVQEADEAHLIGPAEAQLSYLNIKKILEVAQATQADAIHPGYGFLSENPDFAQAVNDAGIRFVGPVPKVIEAMGRKDRAKEIIAAAGVPIVPGYLGSDQSEKTLKKEIKKIGLPVLIKARAGGGGKGMRLVEKPEEIDAALAAAKREALASFGDDHVIIEKYIKTPRHIEVQVFGDDHGNVVHMFERDCSMQRRYQKVIEEAPAPDIPDAMRDAMTQAAVAAAQEIGYSGAGTVEFIVDASKGLAADKFWFMEMNTRLQVEHPVTEAITGLDLVEWQLRIANGEPLPLRQDHIEIKGHAIEARVYAEDPQAGFLPASGKIRALKFGSARVDTGLTNDDTVSSHYDPMIAKVIAHGQTRAQALSCLEGALEQTLIEGPKTNLDFLSRLVTLPEFQEAKLDTGLIDRALDTLLDVEEPDNTTWSIAAILLLGPQNLGAAAFGFAHFGAARTTLTLAINQMVQQVSILRKDAKTYIARIGGQDLHLAQIRFDAATLRLKCDGTQMHIPFHRYKDRVAFRLNGRHYDIGYRRRLSEENQQALGADKIVAPMTGTITLLNHAVGDQVAAGDIVAVMEAMKMELNLKTDMAAKISAIHVKPGQSVSEGTVLIELDIDDG